ncbi:MAG: CDP-archaeol synthase, partial [Pseudomonadota bacterium]
KTWSGAIGGMVGAVLVGLIFGMAHYAFPIIGTIVSALALSIVSQIGDFFESWVKRRKGVKDSGRLIPGHGGFLDRIDGLIPAALLMAVVVALGQGG